MQSLVINISRDEIAVVLLFVHDVVLCTSNNTSILDTLDCLCYGDTSQNWIRTKTYEPCQSPNNYDTLCLTYLPSFVLLQVLCQLGRLFTKSAHWSLH